VAAAAVAVVLTGAFAKPKPAPPRAAASPSPAPVAIGAGVVDHRAGISYPIPAGPGWGPIQPAALGRWTMGYRKLAQRSGKGATGSPGTVWAELESAPLPSSYRYTGPRDLRSDGVRLAGELAAADYASPHTTMHLGVTRQAADQHGDARYIVKFRVAYPTGPSSRGKATGETAAVVIAGRGARERPGVLFITVPDTMDTSVVSRIAHSVASVR
jgi:hypothetical protein